MRTTVNIDETLLRRAKEVAARRGRPLGDVIDDALRVLLVERPPDQGTQVTLPVFGGSGLQPGVDLEDKAAMAALLGDDSSNHAAR